MFVVFVRNQDNEDSLKKKRGAWPPTEVMQSQSEPTDTDEAQKELELQNESVMAQRNAKVVLL
jgi:hypothetical protein